MAGLGQLAAKKFWLLPRAPRRASLHAQQPLPRLVCITLLFLCHKAWPTPCYPWGVLLRGTWVWRSLALLPLRRHGPCNFLHKLPDVGSIKQAPKDSLALKEKEGGQWPGACQGDGNYLHSCLIGPQRSLGGEGVDSNGTWHPWARKKRKPRQHLSLLPGSVPRTKAHGKVTRTFSTVPSPSMPPSPHL